MRLPVLCGAIAIALGSVVLNRGPTRMDNDASVHPKEMYVGQDRSVNAPSPPMLEIASVAVTVRDEAPQLDSTRIQVPVVLNINAATSATPGERMGLQSPLLAQTSARGSLTGVFATTRGGDRFGTDSAGTA
jgi:hypothetical protein